MFVLGRNATTETAGKAKPDHSLEPLCVAFGEVCCNPSLRYTRVDRFGSTLSLRGGGEAALRA